jgi:hypothetical protein
MNSTRSLTDSRGSTTVGPGDGVYFIGQPSWLDAALLGALQQEAAEQRQTAEKIRAQYFADLGAVGAELAGSAVLRDFVVEHTGPTSASGFANYRYYDIPQSQVPPHVDTDNFGLNLIIMLGHSYAAERRSALLLFPHGPKPLTFLLEPGEVILFNAKEVIHARTPISEDGNENATNMGIGYAPAQGLTDGVSFWHPTEGWSQA